MKSLKHLSMVCVCFIFIHSASSQTSYLTEKQGTYSYKNAIHSGGSSNIAFGNNVKTLADYLHNSIPILKTNKGFDLAVSLTGYSDDEYKTHSWNYGLRGELNFDFQLFLKDANGEGKWTVEPPQWSFEINNTEMGGHGGMLDGSSENLFLRELFIVFPLIKETAPGVRFYDCEARTCGGLVLFNPDRPDYWLAVTLREVVQAKLDLYKDDKYMYDYIKPVIDNMSEAELNAPAYFSGEDDDPILKVNGKGQGLQLMRFNPEYWDKTLPTSAIQFISLYISEYGYACLNEADRKIADEEYLKNNGHISHVSEIMKTINLEEMAKLIRNK